LKQKSSYPPEDRRKKVTLEDNSVKEDETITKLGSSDTTD